MGRATEIFLDGSIHITRFNLSWYTLYSKVEGKLKRLYKREAVKKAYFGRIGVKIKTRC